MNHGSSNQNENSSSDKSKLFYSEGETVLCYHGPLLYEAKCLKAELKNKSPQYLIHYSGWNKSWDEWVSCPRVLKFNDENLRKQQELLATHGTSKIVSKIKATNSRKSSNHSSNLAERLNEAEKSSNDTTDKSNQDISVPSPSQILRNNSVVSNSNLSTTGSDSRKNKRTKVEESNDQDDNYTIKSEIVVKLTDELKQILVDDHQTIMNNNKLITVPATNTIEMILDDYTTYKLEKQFDKNVITATVEALKDYFNVALPTKLLYKFEKLQYVEYFKNSTKKPTQVYGSIHFLRLLVKIGELLSYNYWDEICIKQLILQIEDVIKYIHEYRSTLFSSKLYFSPTSNYSQKSATVTTTSLNST